jgi:acetyl-CoA/propionyl-CoA carboxylase biotin carboxyl carrier protein
MVEVNGRRFATAVHGLPAITNGRSAPQRRTGRPVAGRKQAVSPDGDSLVSPIQGTVIRVGVANGDVVALGEVVCVVEAMKMENELVAHKAGTIFDLTLVPGATVGIGETVATIR